MSLNTVAFINDYLNYRVTYLVQTSTPKATTKTCEANNKLGNGICDEELNNVECNFDSMDCKNTETTQEILKHNITKALLLSTTMLNVSTTQNHSRTTTGKGLFANRPIY